VQEASDRERSTNELVRLMERLRALDKVAYVRFASGIWTLRISRNSCGVTGPFERQEMQVLPRSEMINEIPAITELLIIAEDLNHLLCDLTVRVSGEFWLGQPLGSIILTQ